MALARPWDAKGWPYLKFLTAASRTCSWRRPAGLLCSGYAAAARATAAFYFCHKSAPIIHHSVYTAKRSIL